MGRDQEQDRKQDRERAEKLVIENKKGKEMRLPKIEENWLDRAIGAIAPGKAVERRRARYVLALTGSYEGARKDRRGLSTYLPKGGSADADINYDLETLRNRSRDLARNSPVAGGAIHTAVNNVVGTGLRLNARLDREALSWMSDEEAKEFEQRAERGFRVWEQEADLERNLTFGGLQSTVFRSALESGDAIVIMPFLRRAGEAFGLKLQVIEGDRLSNPSGRADSQTLSGGVELDAYGAPVKYHIMSCHPGDIKAGTVRKWDEYPAFTSSGRRAVLHLYDKTRPGQHRGVPYLAPVIEPLKQLARYTDAEIMAAVVSGMFTVFTTTESGQGMAVGMPESGVTATDTDEKVKMDYGAIIDLAPGEKVDFANPGRPNTAFDPFITSVLKQIGMGLQLPYEVLMKSFLASYSAARAAILDAWVFYRCRRGWLEQTFCRPVYEAWMTEAIARGYLYAPGFSSDPIIRQAYLGSEWIGAGMQQIDPVKEIEAAKGRVELKVSTRAEECLLLTGTDWEAKLPQIMREDEMFGKKESDKAAERQSDKEEEKLDDTGDEE